MTYTCTCIYKRAQISDSTETCKIGSQDIVILCNLNIFIFFYIKDINAEFRNAVSGHKKCASVYWNSTKPNNEHK